MARWLTRWGAARAPLATGGRSRGTVPAAATTPTTGGTSTRRTAGPTPGTTLAALAGGLGKLEQARARLAHVHLEDPVLQRL